MAENKRSFRRPFPQFNPFRPALFTELNRRKLQSVDAHVPTSIPFVRFTSLVESPNKYTFFTLGMHGYKDQEKDIFELSYGGTSDVVGYGYNAKGEQVIVRTDELVKGTLDQTLRTTTPATYAQNIDVESSRKESEQKINFAAGRHPTPGVTSMHVKRAGLGTPIIATVDYVCYNRSQMEFLRNHFMTAGLHVTLEWGQQYSDKRVVKMLDFGSRENIMKVFRRTIASGREYIISDWVEPNNGNYDFMIGVVSNFEVQMDSGTGMYTCTVTVVSPGEQFRGLSNFMTFIDKVDSDRRTPTTIAEFFRVGGTFDLLIEKLASDPAKVADHSADWARKGKPNLKKTDFKEMSTNPEDYRFISWGCFSDTVIPALFDLVTEPRSRNSLKRLLNFNVNDDKKPFNEQYWVGDNPHLKSCNPDVMVLVKKQFEKDVPKGLESAGYFDDWTHADGYRGKLAKGVWLNTGMIRKCFLKENNVDGSIRAILGEMNDATDSFWKLQLYFDEVGEYKVVDVKYSDPQAVSSFYKFNVGNTSECLSVNLDSAFPPEMVTQMMLYGYYRSSSGAKKRELLEKLPAIGMANTFIFSMNWTNLHDLITDELSTNPINANDLLPDGPQVVGMENAEDATKSRVISIGGGVVLTPQISNNTTVIPNKPIGTNTILTNPAPADATAVKPVRKSVKGEYGHTVKSLVDPRLDSDFVTRFRILKDYIESQDKMIVEIVQTWRSQAQQDKYYAQGPDTTRAKKSKHTSGQAADLLIYPNDGRKRTQDQKEDATAKYYDSGRLTELADKFGLETLEKYTNQGKAPYDPGHVQAVGKRKKPKDDSVDLLEKADNGEFGAKEFEAERNARDDEETKKREEDIKTRFGDAFTKVIELSPSSMTGRITRMGYEQDNKPNGHVIGFPTTTSITVSFVGLGGISVSDGFMVDKIPFVFEQYGMFQVVEVAEKITTSGWVTTIRGIFKLLRLENGTVK